MKKKKKVHIWWITIRTTCVLLCLAVHCRVRYDREKQLSEARQLESPQRHKHTHNDAKSQSVHSSRSSFIHSIDSFFSMTFVSTENAACRHARQAGRSVFGQQHFLKRKNAIPTFGWESRVEREENNFKCLRSSIKESDRIDRQTRLFTY